MLFSFKIPWMRVLDLKIEILKKEIESSQILVSHNLHQQWTLSAVTWIITWQQMIENRVKYLKNASSFPLPKIPLVDSSKPASVDQMWNMFAVNITIKVNHVISIENWTYRRHARGFGIVELEKIARGFRCYPNEITELLTLHVQNTKRSTYTKLQLDEQQRKSSVRNIC